MNYLAERVKYALEFSGTTQKQAALAGGVSVGAVNGLCRGNSKNPKYSTLVGISKATGFTVEWLMKQETIYESYI